MQVVLLERIEKLGQMGDVVAVKDGYARNWLLPQKKALRATEDNLKIFEAQRAQLEARNLELKKEAEAVGRKLDGHQLVIVRQAGETGQLYGSATVRDIAEALTADGFTVERTQVQLNQPIKVLGLQEVIILLHPEVKVAITVNVARSEEDAERQLAGAQEDALKAQAEEIFESADLAQAAVEELVDEAAAEEPAEVAAEPAEQTDAEEDKQD